MKKIILFMLIFSLVRVEVTIAQATSKMMQSEVPENSTLKNKTHRGVSVARNMVLVEISTGVNCGACSGAARAADDLTANGDPVAIIEWHNFLNADPFYTVFSAFRAQYYQTYGWPTAYFDGDTSYMGGSYHGSVYPKYYPLVYDRMEDSSSFVIDDIAAGKSSISDTTFWAVVTVTKVNDYPEDSLHLFLALTESHIPYNWGIDMTELNFVARILLPDTIGCISSFDMNVPKQFQFTLNVPSEYVLENCELVAFLQNHTSKEVVQTQKVNLGQIVGFHENSSISTAVYPNPASNSITVESSLALKGITLFNGEGRVIQYFDVQGNTAQIDISFLKKGIYFLGIKNSKGRLNRKFIKY
jgi:hypothetical protein